MKPLNEIQTLFQQALLQEKGAADFLPLIKSTGKLSAKDRLQIYRGSVFANISDALKISYPICAKILGDDFYEYAQDFIRNHSSQQQNLNHYGAEFANYLNVVADIPYLVDLAKLEWLWDQCMLCRDDESFNLIDRLAKVLPVDQDKLIFKLSNSVSLLQSAYPVKKIWDHHQSSSKARHWEPAGERLLIWRSGYQRRIDLLTDLEWEFLRRLASGKSFGVILDELMRQRCTDDAKSIASLLPSCVERGWIVRFMTA